MKWRTWLHWLLMPANGRGHAHAHDEEARQRSLAEQRRDALRKRLLAIEAHVLDEHLHHPHEPHR